MKSPPPTLTSPMSAVQAAYLYNHRPSSPHKFKAIRPLKTELTSVCTFAITQANSLGQYPIMKILLAHFSRQHSMDYSRMHPH